VHASLPAVISITERAPEVRFPNFKGILGAKKKPITVLSLGDLSVAEPSAHSLILSTAERPAREAGTKIIDEGNAGVELAEFLVAGHLI
jgi:electron transfer flavoprotein beta subunit